MPTFMDYYRAPPPKWLLKLREKQRVTRALLMSVPPALGSVSSLAPLRASGWCQMIASAAKRLLTVMVCWQVEALPHASVTV